MWWSSTERCARPSAAVYFSSTTSTTATSTMMMIIRSIGISRVQVTAHDETAAGSASVTASTHHILFEKTSMERSTLHQSIGQYGVTFGCGRFVQKRTHQFALTILSVETTTKATLDAIVKIGNNANSTRIRVLPIQKPALYRSKYFCLG